MKLFCSPNSPYARKVRTVLREKGLACEEVFVDLANPPEEFESANPNMRVPCLIDVERKLFESNVIVDYLLTTYADAKAGDAPAPPLAQALVRPETQHRWDDWQILIAIETLLDSALNVFQFNRLGIGPDQASYLQTEHTRIQKELDWLEKKAGPEGFVPGTFSIAEMNLTIALEWADFRKPFPWHGRPNLEAMLERNRGRATLLPTRPGD